MNLTNKTILITGATGFIGPNLVIRCLQDQESVTIIGVDNKKNYYGVSTKEYRSQSGIGSFIYKFSNLTQNGYP